MRSSRYATAGLLPPLLLAALAVPAGAQVQSHSVVNSPHNLSVTGPGAIRATQEQDVCIFCHAPHNASPVQPLWNRNMPVSAYTPYSSSSLQARPGQPTGTSKLCLSCHDGTIALGSVVSRDQPIQMANGMTTLPPGKSNLGTDLSDDHPISFQYDQSLVSKNLKLKNPTGLPPTIKLDSNQELQCTSCHDAHDDSNGNFLVMDNSTSQLCTTCHNEGTTDVLAHQQCSACHVSHTAPSKAFLLTGTTATATCTTTCHSGGAGTNQGPNILAELGKYVKHDTNSPTSQAPAEHVPNDVNCNDCHEPHTILSQSATAPLASPKMGSISGVNASGAAVPHAQFQYEVCFKCHADVPATKPKLISRQVMQTNKRLQFASNAVSYHPVETQGQASSVPSLLPPLTTASMIYCTDCHNSDSAAGSGPNGPHGSANDGLLIASYTTADQTPESSAAYALCYRCHNRDNILADASFPKHHLHVVDNRTPCSVCHDSHGIASSQGTATNHSHLINFDTSVVQPDPVTGRLEFSQTAPGNAECYLSCHGVAHSPNNYNGPGAVARIRLKPKAAAPKPPVVAPRKH